MKLNIEGRKIMFMKIVIEIFNLELHPQLV